MRSCTVTLRTRKILLETPSKNRDPTITTGITLRLYVIDDVLINS